MTVTRVAQRLKGRSAKPRRTATVFEDPQGTRWFQTSRANARVMGLSKHRQNDISIITRTGHEGRERATCERKREKRERGEVARGSA